MISHLLTPSKPTPFKPLNYNPVFSTLKSKNTIGFSASLPAFRHYGAVTGLKCQGKESFKVTCAMKRSYEDGDYGIVLDGTHKDRLFRIQVSSGSTRNVLSRSKAKEFGCTLTAITPFEYTMANGSRFDCSFKCEGFCWEMGGKTYEADFLVVDLGRFDVILGVEWMVSLGEITMNMKERTMMFELQGKKQCLKGIK